MADRNGQFIAAIALAYSTRCVVREEHLMFSGAKGKSTPVSLTVVPVLYGQSSTTSFDDRFVRHSPSSSSPRSPPPDPSPLSPTSGDSASLTAHAFAADDASQSEVAAAQLRVRAEEMAEAAFARSQEIARVVLVIENKELTYRLTQQTKRLKEYSKTNRRQSGYSPYPDLDADGAAAAQSSSMRRRSLMSVVVPQPKLDTGISSAMTLMQTLARNEKNGAKRKMYAEIIHMLSHSKGMESVNDDVINQIEENDGVGKDVKSWLINQIAPTNTDADQRLDEKEKEKNQNEQQNIANAAKTPLLAPALHVDPNTDDSDSDDRAKAGGSDSQAALHSPTRKSLSTKKVSIHQPAVGGGGDASASSLPKKSISAPRDSKLLRGSMALGRVSVIGGDIELEAELPKGLSMQAGDAQFVDPSPDISLIKSSFSSPTRANNRSSASDTNQSGSGPGSHNGSVVLASGRRKTFKERKSTVENKKSLTSRTSATTDASTPSIASNVQRLLTATASLTTAVVSATTFAPSRSPIVLPLQMVPSAQKTVVERAAESRVQYSNWSGPLMGLDDNFRKHSDSRNQTDSPIKSPKQKPLQSTPLLTATVPSQEVGEKSTDRPATGTTEGAVITKESIFTVVGCHPPEIHANAALDVNAQTLFWAPASQRPKTVDPNAVHKHSLLHSPIYLTPQQESALAMSLSQLSVWNQFNIFHVSARSQGWPLTFTFTTIVTQLDLMGKWGLDATLVSNFVREVERGYFAIPYHSSTHAADVLQHTYHMITQTHIGLSLTDLDMLILLVAAAVHDYGHPGVSNQYLTTTFSPLALQYNDKNVLESYHIASIFLLMQAKPECNIFQHMDPATYRKARKMLIDLVLATDLASHFDILAVWKRKESILDLGKDEDKMLVMQMVLKSGDLGHPSRVRHLHLTWSELVCEEFFMQGDRERKNGMNVSAMMDRSTCNIVTSQIGFISFLVMPIYSAFSAYAHTDMYAMLVRANLAMWERLNIESEELKRAKEEEEIELRRMALEKEEMETRKRREELDKARELKERAQEFENDIAEQARQEEEEKQQAKQKEAELTSARQSLQDAQRLVDQELSKKSDAERSTDKASAIIDVRLRRENDEEWTLADISDSDSEAEDGTADEAEAKERERRRSNRVKQTEAERDAERQARRVEKLEQRLREQEERRAREIVLRREEQSDLERAEQERAERWEKSKERIEKEIDERTRTTSLALQAKHQQRGRTKTDPEPDDPAEDHGVLLEVLPADPLQPAEADAPLQRVGTPNVSRREESPAAGGRPSSRPLSRPVVQAEGGEAVVAEVAAKDGEERLPSPPLSPAATQRQAFASMIAKSIVRDKERMDAERERSRLRVEKEKARLLSAEERRSAEEAARLERKVKRLLRKEQAAARAMAKQAELDALLGADDAGAMSARELLSARKKVLLESARARGKSVALREVTMLMMDKEWGVRRRADEERRIMLDYLRYVDDDGADEADDVEEKEKDRRVSRRSRSSLTSNARGSTTGHRTSAVMPSPSLAPNAEEWEEEGEGEAQAAETGQTAGGEQAKGVGEEEGSDESVSAGEGWTASASEADSEADGPPAPPADGRRSDGSRSEHRPSLLPRLHSQLEADDELDSRRSPPHQSPTDHADVSQPQRESTGESHPAAPRPTSAARVRSREERRALSRERRRSMASHDEDPLHAGPRRVRRHRHHVSFHEHPIIAVAVEQKERTSPTPSLPHPATADAEADYSSDPPEPVSSSSSDDSDRAVEESKESLVDPSPSPLSERRRLRDKHRAVTAQQRRADRELPRAQRSRAAARDSPSHSSHPFPPLAASPSASSSFAPFVSFPPLTLPQLVPAPHPASSAAQSALSEALYPFFSGPPVGTGMIHSRPLLAAKAEAGAVAEVKGSDWRAADDEEAMAAILRRVIPRSRQAELERARRAIVTKAKMRGMGFQP